MKKAVIGLFAAAAICSADVAHAELICGSDPYFAARFPELCQKFRAIDARAAELRETERKCVAAFDLTVDTSGARPWWYGMTDVAAVRVWCTPDHVNTTVLPRGTHEQWVYRGHGYLYFDNGRLVAIQKSN